MCFLIQISGFISGLKLFFRVSLIGKKTWRQNQSDLKVNIINQFNIDLIAVVAELVWGLKP